MATKNSTSKKVETDKRKIRCKVCGKEKTLNAVNYYQSNREEYKEYGCCPTCKICLRRSTIDTNLGTVTKESIVSALKKLDKPLVDEIFLMIKEREVSNEKFLGEYITQLNISKYKNLTYADTVDLEIEQEKRMNAKVDYVKDQEITDEMKRFWGGKLLNEDYLDLQARFDRFIENEENPESMDYKKELDYKKLCVLEFQLSKIQYDMDKIKEATQLNKNIADLSNDLGIKAIQKKEDRNSNKHYIAGLITKFIENVKKEPILKPEDYMKGYNKSEFEEELRLNFTAPLLDSFEMSNPFKEEWEKDKKKYEPTKEEVEAFADSKDDEE